MAREGLPPLALAVLACWLTYHYAGLAWASVPAAALVLLYLVFRDPRRAIPSAPLGVVSPVDGKVISVEKATRGVLQGEARRLVLGIDPLGTYTARSPVEGKIRDLREAASERAGDYPTNALWLQTDEGEDVVLYFTGYRLGVPPKPFVRLGERLGQGARCAYLRLTRHAEVHLPVGSKLLVEPGQRVRAGSDLIAKLPHP